MVMRHVRAHGPQFFRYLVSGGTAAGLELGSYKVMLLLGIWYLGAAFVSAMIGLLSAFVLHKYFVFKKKEETRSQVIRYIMLQSFNAIAQTALVYVFVEFVGTGPFIAKILGIGCTVMWNFFLYKFFVYA